MSIPPSGFPETTQVIKLLPKLPVADHLLGCGFSACNFAANTISSDERKYESMWRLQITVPLPVPSSVRSVKMTPTFRRPHKAATSSTAASDSQGKLRE